MRNQKQRKDPVCGFCQISSAPPKLRAHEEEDEEERKKEKLRCGCLVGRELMFPCNCKQPI